MAGDIDIATERATNPTRSPAVETASGRVAGITSGGVHVFKGIPYGASTAGANRFMPPRKPEPWTGVREATAYAGRSPQAPAGAQRPELATVWGPVDTLPVGEDCLTLHVWTPALDNSKRPVMVWLHGGAFSYGSANSPRYDSTNLARRNDVVVVAVNHRLNIFGHLDLSGIGDERFAQSGNVGILDLVAALEWVREHAAALRRRSGQCHDLRSVGRRRKGQRAAGNAERQGPLPQGDRAKRRQCALCRARAHDASRRRRAEASRAGPGPARCAAGAAAGPLAGGGRAGAEDAAAPGHPLLDRYNFGPVIDGRVLPAHPFDPAAPALSDDVPIMIGGTKDETAIFLAPDDAVWNRAVTEDDLRKRIAAVAGDAADELLAYYKRRDPTASPSDRLITALTASNFGVRSVMLAERKAARARRRSGCTASTGRRRHSAGG